MCHGTIKQTQLADADTTLRGQAQGRSRTRCVGHEGPLQRLSRPRAVEGRVLSPSKQRQEKLAGRGACPHAVATRPVPLSPFP